MSLDSTVIPLRSGRKRNAGKPSPERQAEADAARAVSEARELARLGCLNALDYERDRVTAAKKLGVRVAFLDSIIGRIRRDIAAFKGDYKVSHTDARVGKCIDFHNSQGQVITSWCIASGQFRWHPDEGKDANLVLLADGNATVVRGRPLSDQPVAERPL
jgi:hypothetical protein